MITVPIPQLGAGIRTHAIGSRRERARRTHEENRKCNLSKKLLIEIFFVEKFCIFVASKTTHLSVKEFSLKGIIRRAGECSVGYEPIAPTAPNFYWTVWSCLLIVAAHNRL